MHRHHPDWSSHMPVLIKAVQITNGPVLELGMGISSTPLLHMLCSDQDRHLVSYDHEPQFVEMFRRFRSQGHEIKLVEDWDLADLSAYNWSVALVDHKPGERRQADIRRLLDTELVVIHDSEPGNDDIFGYENIYPLFKYRFNYTKARTHTTVLSNHNNLEDFHAG